MSLTLPQLTTITMDDPYLGEALTTFLQAFNNLTTKLAVSGSAPAQAGATPATNYPAPSPPASLTVAAVVVSSSKIYGVLVGPSPDADDSIRYSLEFSSTADFATSTVAPLAQLTFGTLLLPNATFYWRVRCQFVESSFSSYAYFGSAANPTGV